jgi:hypothetical protein
LSTLATITAKGAGIRSLNDTWADATTAHGRLMPTVLGGLWARYLEAAEPQFLIFAYRLLTKMSYGLQTVRNINIIL